MLQLSSRSPSISRFTCDKKNIYFSESLHVRILVSSVTYSNPLFCVRFYYAQWWRIIQPTFGINPPHFKSLFHTPNPESRFPGSWWFNSWPFIAYRSWNCNPPRWVYFLNWKNIFYTISGVYCLLLLDHWQPPSVAVFPHRYPSSPCQRPWPWLIAQLCFCGHSQPPSTVVSRRRYPTTVIPSVFIGVQGHN
jgi:hypothetical protein